MNLSNNYWHTYGVAIEPSGTVWYVDGIQVCHTAATADAQPDVDASRADIDPLDEKLDLIAYATEELVIIREMLDPGKLREREVTTS